MCMKHLVSKNSSNRWSRFLWLRFRIPIKFIQLKQEWAHVWCRPMNSNMILINRLPKRKIFFNSCCIQAIKKKIFWKSYIRISQISCYQSPHVTIVYVDHAPNHNANLLHRMIENYYYTLSNVLDTLIALNVKNNSNI